jgi:hypothetical protein
LGAFDETGCATYGFEGANGGINTPGNAALGTFEQFNVFINTTAENCVGHIL